MVTYKESGVDIDAGNQLVKDIKDLISKTYDESVVGEIGGFSGTVKLHTGERISMATDGVGTKLLIAQQAAIHHTVGIDLVAMSVNDLIVGGSRPVAFLDYLATGKLDIGVAYEILEGVVEGCIQAECPLVGGETAELPGMYPDGMYDLAGFAVGEPTYNINKAELKEGNILLGVESSGVHSNGYSLIRRVFMPEGSIEEFDRVEVPPGFNLLEELIRPTMIYVKALKAVFTDCNVLGVSHITGGGLEENVPRMLGPGLAALVSISAWPVPYIFELIKEYGNVPEEDMRRTFNCGIGLVIALHKDEVDMAQHYLHEAGYNSFEIGSITKAEGDKVFSYIP